MRLYCRWCTKERAVLEDSLEPRGVGGYTYSCWVACKNCEASGPKLFLNVQTEAFLKNHFADWKEKIKKQNSNKKRADDLATESWERNMMLVDDKGDIY